MQYDLLTDEGFEQYVDSIDPELLKTSEGRRVLTELDPLAFALIYLPHHLKGPQTGDRITFSDLHVALIEDAKRWVIKTTKPRQQRHVYVAPRESGKSSWAFAILPLWSAAHGHDDFIAAFSDSGGQAQLHLASFKRELDTNELLREDFPELCTPARRPSGATEGDSQKIYKALSGFVFAAGGVDQGVLGMKAGNKRPSRLLLDDVEPGEAQYSAYQCKQRLTTVLDSILALNEFAPVTWVGTVTMPGSMVHQLVRSIQPNELTEPWIVEQNFRVHHFLPIVTDPETGEERSIWPAKWTLEYLQSIRHTRSYKKNFANDPMGMDGEYWRDEDFVYEELEGCTKTLLSIDPCVTEKRTSDPTGLAVVSYKPKKVHPPERAGLLPKVEPSRCMVEYADDVRKTGSRLRAHVLGLLNQYPDIALILIESNQGGELWLETFHDMPVKVEIVNNSVSKDVRAARLHVLYQHNRVTHAQRFNKAEEQMVSYPGTHDDIVDAVGTGVFYFIKPAKKPKGGLSSTSYV